MFSGESLSEALSIINKYSPQAVMINCIHPAQVEGLIYSLKRLTDKPLGVYANIGNPNARDGSFDSVVSPEAYFVFAKRWKEIGVRIIGGCCGTTPVYIQKLNSLKK